jgi:biopolymer transport protein ExbB
VWSIVMAAGWPIWPLIIASITAVALIIERSFALQLKRVYPAGLLEAVLSDPDRAYGPQSLAELGAVSPLGTILAGGLASRQRDRAHLQYALEIAGNKAAAALERFLPLISMLASIAPLMGLLGTVVGMIEIFGSQSAAGNDPQALAHGISVALYNTAFGLIVAIPTAIAHRIFRIRVDQYIHALENAAHLLLETLSTSAEQQVAKNQAWKSA